MESDMYTTFSLKFSEVWFSVNRTYHYSCQVKTLWSWTDLWGCCKVGFVSVIKGPWGLREFWCLQKKKRLSQLGNLARKNIHLGEILIFLNMFCQLFKGIYRYNFQKMEVFIHEENFSNEMLQKNLPYFWNILLKYKKFFRFWFLFEALKI